MILLVHFRVIARKWAIPHSACVFTFTPKQEASLLIAYLSSCNQASVCCLLVGNWVFYLDTAFLISYAHNESNTIHILLGHVLIFINLKLDQHYNTLYCLQFILVGKLSWLVYICLMLFCKLFTIHIGWQTIMTSIYMSNALICKLLPRKL